jgi:hypothetical protein
LGAIGGFVVGAGIAAIPTIQHTSGETLDVLNHNPALKNKIIHAMRDYYKKSMDAVSRKCPDDKCPTLDSKTLDPRMKNQGAAEQVLRNFPIFKP